MSITDETKSKMATAIEHLKEELHGIRTGQANPGMFEGVMVEVYGSPMRLRDIASITIPEPRQLLITPYDSNNAAPIGKAIDKANLGFTPVVDGNAVRIQVPQMDDGIRKEMCKLCDKRREEAKVAIRNIRREGNDTVRKQKGDGDISEDLMHTLEDEIQKLTDSFCKQADTIAAKKEEEISTV